MVDLVDKGEAELQQLTQKVTMTASSASMKASLWVGKNVAATPFKVVSAVYRAIQQSVNAQRETGRVALKEFTRIAEGKRELVNIDDNAVSKELERELRRHGVLWSAETHRDGSRTFHIQGKDAELIQHALTVSAERVDEKLARNAPELQNDAPQQEHEHEHEQAQSQEHEQQPQQGEQARTDDHDQEQVPVHGTDELREDAPRIESAEVSDTRARDDSAAPERTATQPDEAVTDRGGHSIEREPAITRSEQRPEKTASDRTRAHVAEKIDRKVEQRKSEMEQTKTRTKKRTQSRSTADDAQQAPKANRR